MIKRCNCGDYSSLMMRSDGHVVGWRKRMWHAVGRHRGQSSPHTHVHTTCTTGSLVSLHGLSTNSDTATSTSAAETVRLPAEESSAVREAAEAELPDEAPSLSSVAVRAAAVRAAAEESAAVRPVPDDEPTLSSVAARAKVVRAEATDKMLRVQGEESATLSSAALTVPDSEIVPIAAFLCTYQMGIGKHAEVVLLYKMQSGAYALDVLDRMAVKVNSPLRSGFASSGEATRRGHAGSPPRRMHGHYIRAFTAAASRGYKLRQRCASAKFP